MDEQIASTLFDHMAGVVACMAFDHHGGKEWLEVARRHAFESPPPPETENPSIEEILEWLDRLLAWCNETFQGVES